MWLIFISLITFCMRTRYILQNTEGSMAATKGACICNKEQHNLILNDRHIINQNDETQNGFKLSKDDDRLMMV